MSAPTGEEVETLPGIVVTIGDISAGSSGTADFTSYELLIRTVTITVTRDVSNAKVAIEEFTAKPSWASTPPNIAYSYYDSVATNLADSDISFAAIEFRVNRSWIALNNIDERTVRMLRFTTSWQELPTSYIGSDPYYLYFRATTSGLSLFAIAGEQEAAPPITPPPIVPTPIPAPTAVPSEFFAVLSIAGVFIGFSIAYGLIKPSKIYLMLKQLEREVSGPRMRRIGKPLARPPKAIRKEVSRAELDALKRLEEIMQERRKEMLRKQEETEKHEE